MAGASFSAERAGLHRKIPGAPTRQFSPPKQFANADRGRLHTRTQ
jgi:hypothetical protein